MSLTFVVVWALTTFSCIQGGIISNLLSAPSNGSSLNYSPYYKGPVCTPSSAIQHPTSVEEVVSIVQNAIENGKTVKAFGVKHSATDIICTNGIPIDMTGIRGMEMNPSDQSVTVGAGVNLHDLAEFLKANQRALKTTPGFGNITIGGAVGTGAHGSSIKYTSSISEQVIGVTIVDGYGDIREITDPVKLQGFRIHLGLLGIILTITFRTEPLYKVRGHNYIVSDAFLMDGTFKDAVKNTDQISLYWFPSTDQVVIANWTIVDVDTPGEAWTNDHVPSTYTTFNSIAVPAFDAIHLIDVVSPGLAASLLNRVQAATRETLLTNVPNFAPIYTYNGITVSNPAVGYYHEMFAPICDDKGFAQCPWFHGPFNLTQLDNEFAIDIDKMPELAKTLKDIVAKYPAFFVFQGILLRFSAASKTYMSTAYGRDTCHFEFYMFNAANPYVTASAGLAAYQTILQSVFFKYGGKSHWGKSGAVYHSADNVVRNVDPIAKDAFLNLMDEYDPDGIFLNDFGERLKGTGTKMNTDPEVTRCALLDNCFCSSNLDCAPGQKCGNIDAYPDYPACINPLVEPGLPDLDSKMPLDLFNLLSVLQTKKQ